MLRRQKLHLAELFDPIGRYRYSAGVNWRAMIALVLAVSTCVPGFLNASTGGRIVVPDFFKSLYTYAWFVTFAIGFVLYGVLMIGHPNLPEHAAE